MDVLRHEMDRVFDRLFEGTFTRAFRMPVAVSGDKLTATFKDGMLTVTLPKAPDAKGTTIPVKPA